MRKTLRIRIDRYYSGAEDDVDVSHQPMMCQHCANAPCETVCPVLATAHGDEGLNEQVYIWFSQYMLIWYSNIPEETSYFIRRTQGSFGPLVFASLALNWVIPFFVLLPRSSKRSENIKLRIAVVILIGRWLDLYLMIFPPLLAKGPVFGLPEIASLCCLSGLAAILFLRSSFPKKTLPL